MDDRARLKELVAEVDVWKCKFDNPELSLSDVKSINDKCAQIKREMAKLRQRIQKINRIVRNSEQ